MTGFRSHAGPRRTDTIHIAANLRVVHMPLLFARTRNGQNAPESTRLGLSVERAVGVFPGFDDPEVFLRSVSEITNAT